MNLQKWGGPYVTSIRQMASGARRLLVQCRLPRVVTLRDFDSSGVRFEISRYMEHIRVIRHGMETEYLAKMLKDLRDDDVFFDVGANVGLVALHAAKVCQTVAFEPDPSYRQRLEVNATLNPDLPITIEPIALSDSDENVVLYTDGVDGHSPSLVRHGETGTASVSARSLDSLLAEGRLPRPTVIKLDIEGAEILALRGAKQLLAASDRPRALFIEIHNSFLPDFGSSADEVYTMLQDFGYTDTVYSAQRNDQTHLILHSSKV